MTEDQARAAGFKSCGLLDFEHVGLWVHSYGDGSRDYWDPRQPEQVRNERPMGLAGKKIDVRPAVPGP
jgi:hypothetical protein